MFISKDSKFSLVPFFIIAILFASVPACGGFKKRYVDQKTCQSEKIIKIGVLTPYTGPNAHLAQEVKAALDLANKHINQYLKDISSPNRVKLIYKNAKDSTAVVIKKIHRLQKQNIRIILGPMMSSELKGSKAFIDQNKSIFISPSSSASSLTFFGDPVYRLCPNNHNIAKVTAEMFAKDHIKAIIPLYRRDVWGEDLAYEIREIFPSFQGKVLSATSYHTRTKSFFSQLKQLEQKVSKACKQYGKDRVAVYAICMEEIIQILDQAQHYYPSLARVRWYGINGKVAYNILSKNKNAFKFASRSSFITCSYTGQKSEKHQRISDSIQAITQKKPHMYSLIMYDALWIAALSSLLADHENIDSLKKAIPVTADFYYGASGWTKLNEMGTRKIGNYDFYQVSSEEGKSQWKKIARYRSNFRKPILQYIE